MGRYEASDKLLFILNHYGRRAQVNKLFEELGEVMIELSKFQANKGVVSHLAEEIADVQIMFDQLILSLGLGKEVARIRKIKIERQLERIANEGIE